MNNRISQEHGKEQPRYYTSRLNLETKKKSDRFIDYFLACYFLVGLVLASFYETWLIAFTVGGLCLVGYYSVKILLPTSNLYQYVLSSVLGIFMAQFIYQMHGMFEMHFFAFIGSAILITYQKWKLQIPLLVFVILHHLTFGYLQNIGTDNVYFTQLDFFELRTFIIHFVLAAIIFFICGLWSYHLKKYSDIRAMQTMDMEKLQTANLLMVKEQAAIESNNRFSYAAQATSDAIWDRNFADEVVFWGEGFRTLFGYENTPETTCVNFWASKVHPEDLENTVSITQQAKDNANVNTWSASYRFLKANGEYAFVREKAIILRDDQGIPSRTIGALQDISDSILKLKKLEKVQHEAQLEKAVAQGKFEIASEVMHDIGNAVVGFGSYLTRIRRLQEQGNQENLEKLILFFEAQKREIASSVGEIKADAILKLLSGIAQTEKKNQDETSRSIAEQLKIITNIEEILHIQRQYITGHESIERKPIYLKNIIDDSLAFLFTSIEKTSVDISLKIADDIPHIKGDRTKLMQLVLTVIKNSIEAIKDNNAEKKICIDAFRENGKLFLRVKDNGKGFTKDTSGQIFTRGFTTKTKGSGQSLYNCKSIVESHEGTIEITSEGIGKGATASMGFKI